MSIRKGNSVIAGNPSIESVANVDLSNLSTTGKHYVAFKGYDSTTSYSLNDVVVSIQNNEVKIYQSLADNNTSSLSDTTKWKEVSLGGGGEIGDMGFAPLGIDESLNLRRYLNGQVISQSLSPAFTTKVKAAIALHSSLGTTEANWQSEKTLSKLGQCGKFVIDDENQTIRLPAVVNAQGLLSLSGIGNLVNESLPNITGTSYSPYGQFNSASGAFSIGGTTSRNTNPSASPYDCSDDLYFDASLSSSTYQNGAPVQQEAIQYPYYIQVATGVEETLPAIREYKVNNSDFFGKSMYSDVAPDNASWLASNDSYNARTVYPDYYNWLVSHIGETITANGGKVVLSTDTITDYDWVVNQNDETFRLPLLDGSEDLEGNVKEDWTLQASGSSYPITKNGTIFLSKSSTTAGQVVQLIGRYEYPLCISSATSQNIAVTLKVKKGDPLIVSYTAGGTTNRFCFIPAVGNGTLYYYVGDTVQDASLINAGAVLGQLANKADIDASNFNATGKSTLAGLGMPSSKQEIWTAGASGSQYIIPANGYFCLRGAATAVGGSVQMYTDNNVAIMIPVYATGQVVKQFLPVRKGSTLNLYYTNMNLTTSGNFIYFVYAEGEK